MHQYQPARQYLNTIGYVYFKNDLVGKIFRIHCFLGKTKQNVQPDRYQIVKRAEVEFPGVLTLGCNLGPLGPKVGATADFTRVQNTLFNSPGAAWNREPRPNTPLNCQPVIGMFFSLTVTSASAPRPRCKNKHGALLRHLVMKIAEPRCCSAGSEDSAEHFL